MTPIPWNSPGRSFRERRRADNLSANFTREFPAYSITVMELKTK